MPTSEESNALAQFNIGLMHRLEFYVESDVTQTKSCYKLTDEQGNQFSIYAISFYEKKEKLL